MTNDLLKLIITHLDKISIFNMLQLWKEIIKEMTLFSSLLLHLKKWPLLTNSSGNGRQPQALGKRIYWELISSKVSSLIWSQVWRAVLYQGKSISVSLQNRHSCYPSSDLCRTPFEYTDAHSNGHKKCNVFSERPRYVRPSWSVQDQSLLVLKERCLQKHQMEMMSAF